MVLYRQNRLCIQQLSGVAVMAEIYGIDDLHEGEGNTVVPYEGVKAEFNSDLGITLQQAKASGTNTGGTNENYFAAVAGSPCSAQSGRWIS